MAEVYGPVEERYFVHSRTLECWQRVEALRVQYIWCENAIGLIRKVEEETGCVEIQGQNLAQYFNGEGMDHRCGVPLIVPARPNISALD